MFSFNLEDMLANVPQQKNFERYKGDERFWKLSKGDNPKSVALIRLLPNMSNIPYVRLYNYSLKKANPYKPGAYLWYFADSADSINKPCPVKERYTYLMQLGTKEGEAQAKLLRRNTKFITNILVVNDVANPQNNGKVFLWSFGVKLKDKIMSWMQPSNEEVMMGATPRNLLNPLEGNNIKLILTEQGEFATYDSSEVIPETSCIVKGYDKDDCIKFIEEKTYNLTEFTSEEFFGSYDENKAKFEKWWGNADNTQSPSISKAQSPKKELDSDFLLDEPTTEKVVTKSMPSVDDSNQDSWLDEL